MKSRRNLFPSSLRPADGGWLGASLRLGLLLALLLLGACEATPAPSGQAPSGQPPVQTATKLPAKRSTASPTPPPQASQEAYPPASTSQAEPYPVATGNAPQLIPTPRPNAVGPYIYYLPMIGGEIIPTSTPQPTEPTSPPPPPEPTDTPRPPWPEPLSGQTTSKLSLHIIAVYPDPDIMEFVRRVHPRVVMSPYDQAGLAQIKAASPGTVTISRFDVSGQESWVSTVPDAAAAANHYVQVNLEQYRQHPSVDYWEGINEFNPQTPAEWQWFTVFEATRACAMQAQGLRAAVGAFAVGYPRTYDEMTIFLPALEAAHRCGAIFTIHEYNGPTMACGVETNIPGIIPGAPALNVPAGPFTLRYRFWYESFLKPRGIADLPLVITELGADGGPPDETCLGPGHNWTWKRYQNSWVRQGWGAIGAEAYVNVLAWYDAEMRKDPYVIGATIFTSGEFATTGWADFDIHEAIIHLALYAARP